MRRLSYFCVPIGAGLFLAGGFLCSVDVAFQSGNGHRTVSELSSDTRDCGAVSLFVIARLSGISDVSLEYLRAVTETGPYGTTMFNLKVAAEHIGFEVAGLQLTPVGLKDRLQYGDKAILHINRAHFVSAVGLTTSGRIVIVDGIKGGTAYDVEGLQRELDWSGKSLVLTTERWGVPVFFRELERTETQ